MWQHRSGDKGQQVAMANVRAKGVAAHCCMSNMLTPGTTRIANSCSSNKSDPADMMPTRTASVRHQDTAYLTRSKLVDLLVDL